MGAYIIGSAVALAMGCEGLVIAGWRLAADTVEQAEARPETRDL